MEILAIIGLIVLGLAIFTGGGILGWMLKGIGEIIDLLTEGWSNIFGCLMWAFIVLLILAGLLL
jgi:hypothetical protein